MIVNQIVNAILPRHTLRAVSAGGVLQCFAFIWTHAEGNG